MFILASFLATAPASADYREFSGRIDQIGENELIVDNRKGDKVTFERTDTTRVEGQGRAAWGDLEEGDWVTISWQLTDQPRKAYEIRVRPPRDP